METFLVSFTVFSLALATFRRLIQRVFNLRGIDREKFRTKAQHISFGASRDRSQEYGEYHIPRGAIRPQLMVDRTRIN